MPIYNLNNKRYNIPDDVVADFERDNPEAIVSYSSGDKVYDIPVNKRDRFLKKYPDAKPYTDNPTESSKPYNHEYDENMNLVGGAAYDDITKGSSSQDPKVQKYILGNKPDMFKPKTVDMYGAHDKDKSELDLMNEGKLYQMKAMRAASTIGEQLSERIKANESALNEARRKQAEENLQSSTNDRGRYSSVGLGGTIKERQEAYRKSFDKSPSRVEQTKMDDDVANLLAEQEYLKESKKVFDAAKNDSGFFQGMKDAIDASYLSFGLTDMLSAERIASVQQKLESGQALTESEQSLLTSLGLQQMVNEQYNDLLGRWYKAGMVTAEMAPFMAEMAVNPLSGLGKSAMKWTVKKFGEKGAKAIAAKVLSRTIGDVAGAAGMAATTGMPGVAADSSGRQRGYVTTELGDKGTIKGVGFEGGENASDTWRKAFTARTIENWSEMVGEYFSPVGKAVGKGFAKAFDKMGLSKVNDFIDNINSSDWVKSLDDFSERTQWNGPLGEFAEEQVGMIANAALVGDTKWSDITDLDKQLDVALGVGVFGTAMSLLRIGGYRTPKYRARKAVENAEKEGLRTYGEELWAKVKETIDLSSDAELGSNLATLLGVTGASQEQAVAAFKYANALKAQQVVNTVKEKAKIDLPDDMEVEAEAAYDEGSELQTPYDKHSAKRAADRAEEALAQDAELAKMVIDGGNNPVATVNAMAESGKYSEAQIKLAKDYYTAVNRMNGLTDALLDKVDSQIESANAEVDANTNINEDTKEQTIVPVTLRDGRQGYVVSGSVVPGEEGSINIGESDKVIVVRVDGKNQQMNPNQHLQSVGAITTPDALKQYNNTQLKQKLVDQAIGEIDWNPATPNPKVGDSFEMNGVPVTIVSHDGKGGMFVVPTEEYQSAVGSEQKMQQLVAKAQQSQPIPASEFKNWASAQLDAQEDAQSMAQQESMSGENVGEQVNTGVNAPVNNAAQQPVEEKRPMTEDEAAEFISRMGANAEPMPNIEFTPENWQAAFGENGTIETPIGTVKMGENQISKLFLKKRTKEFGMIAPTLSNPDIIIEEASSSKEGQSERESSYLFIKTFVKDGQKVRYYTSVTVLQDGMEVSVSSHVLGDKQVPKKLMEGNVIYIKEALSSNSSDGHLAEQPNAVPDLLPTQENNASLSTNKDSDKNVQSQENKAKPFYEREKEEVFRELGEMYGEKMPHKVEVTAKSWADKVKKAQKKVDDAQKKLDDAPIGEDARQKSARDKALQELDAIKKEADFWAEMDAEVKKARASREAMLNPQAEVITSAEPMTTDEFIAQQLAAGNIVLSKADYMAQTGYGNEEVKSMNGGTQKLITDNGMTLDAAGERLMEMDRENGTNFFNQDDATAGRDALIALLGSVRTRKELNQYISENRKAQAKKESEAIRNASEEYVMSGGYESLEDYLDQMEAAEMENLFLEARADEIMAIFAEEATKYEQSISETENGQESTNDAAEGSDAVLPEEQSDNTDGTETDNGSKGVGEGIDEEGEGTYDSEQGDEVIQYVNEEGLLINEDGSPMVLYHGTINKGVNSVKDLEPGHRRDDGEKAVFNGDGVSFTPSESVALDYADGVKDKVFTANIRLNNPFVAYGVANMNEDEARAYSKRLKDAGYDGIIVYASPLMRENGAEPIEVVVFDKESVIPIGPSRKRIIDVFNEAARIAAKHRREQIKARVKMWEAAGVKVKVHERISGIRNMEAKRAIMSGEIVAGWYDGEAHVYLPHIESLAELDRTVLHEAISHMGIKELMGKENFDKLCDKVWEMMPESAQKKLLAYEGVKNIEDEVKQRRASADEYMAHLAEDENLSPEEKSLWQKIVQWFKDLFTAKVDEKEQAVSILNQSRLTNKEISELLKLSYANLKSNAAERIEENVGEVDVEKGDVRFAVRDVLKGEEREQAIKDLMAVTGRSRRTVVKWLKAEESLASVILNEDNVGILDMEADESVPSIWKNSDYPQGTVEFSNICKKRLPFTTIYQRLQKEFPNTLFDAQTLNAIRNTMKEMGEDVACALCFVEDRRQLLGEIGQGFIDAVKGMDVEVNDNQKAALDKLRESGDKYVPNLFDIITLDGMKELRKKHPAVAQAFIEYNNARGMQSGRLFQAYSAYNREILKYNKKKVESINNNGGLRIFSFSDFEAHHLIDLVQVLTDCAAKGLKVQGYTKVPEFAKAVKDTNAKINRSLIPKGVGYVDADYVPKEGEAVSPNVINGKRLLFDTIEGIDVNNPNFFDSTGSKSVGNILVAINDEHARLAMADPFVDYIIGFHTGQSKAILKGKGIDTWVNYKNEQLDKEIVTDENGNQKMKNAPHHGLNIYTDVLNVAEAEGNPIKTAKQFTERFLEECAKRGYVPRFSRFLNRAKDGRFLYTPGYHKFLIDFKLFDKNGKILPQEAVVPKFDNAFNKQILDDYVKGVKEEMPNDAVYEAVKEAVGLGEGTKFRISNQNQEIFVSNAQKAVEGIKQEKGTPQQWLAMIEKNGGLKAGEDKWLGLSDWLKGLDKKSVTKDEILDFISENKIRIEEVHYDEGLVGAYKDDFEDAFWTNYVDGTLQYVQIKDENLAYEWYKEQTGKELKTDENGRLTDRSYRKIEDYANETIVNKKTINSVRMDYTTSGLVNNHEIALTVPSIESWNEDDEIHFGDAGEGRAIAWIRFGETTAPQADFEKAAKEADDALTAYQNELAEKYLGDEGSGDPTEYLDMMSEEEGQHMRELSAKMFDTREAANANQVRVLVIDEIQSKRHQEGREQGYAAKGMSENLKRIEQEMFNANENERQKERIVQDYIEELASKYGSVLSNYTEEENQKLKTLSDNWIEARKMARDLNDAYNKAVKEFSGVPEAPFEKNWSELAFKRMLRYAAENGFDKVAWTTGMQQAGRYDLGTVAEEVRSGISVDGKRMTDIYFRDGSSLNMYHDENGNIERTGGRRSDLIGEARNISEVIGKEIASKILTQSERGSKGIVKYTGIDLSVGGEGMKAFYDKMLPSFVNKYVKKWGTKVQDIELPNVEKSGRIMHSVDVTDAMKESVMEGQTMFRISEKGKRIQTEVDKFTAEFNSKPVAIVENGMDDKELLEAFDNKPELEDLKSFMQKTKTSAGYIQGLGKIIIFADNASPKQIRLHLLHENIHGVLYDENHSRLISEFYEYGKDIPEFAKWLEALNNSEYDKYSIAEEFLAYVVSDGMIKDDLEQVFGFLSDRMQGELNGVLNKIGYDYDNRRRNVEGADSGRGASGTERKSGVQDVSLDAEGKARGTRKGTGYSQSRKASKGTNAEKLRKLFDQVADMGLEGVIGNAEYNRLMLDIFHAMPKDIHGEISVNAVKNLNLDVAKAVSDYLGANDNPSVWEKVAGMVRDALRKVGFDLQLTPNDVKYMLWRSKKPLNRRQALDVAEDIAKRSELGVGEDSGTRFRTKKAVPFDPSDKRDKLVKAYDAFLKTGKFNFIEAFQDRMYSVKVMMDMIVDVTGKKVRDFEDAYTAENQLGSINKPEEERYLKDFYKPLVEVIRELSDKYGREVVERYIYCKSGLERNEVLRQRDADEAYNDAKAELDDKLAKGQLTQPQYDALLQQADDQRQKTLAEDVDYSGIRGMLYNMKAQAINKEYEEKRIDKSTRDAKLAQLEANKKDEVKDWKQFAEDQVAALEAPGKASKAELDKLWKKINAATNETLRMDYESGMIDKETYDAEKNMMKYYVPLRNWADTTAEEMYEYRSELVRPVSSNQKRAKGRESQADNPIATIALMAQNAIVRGNRNKVKQKFYAFVANRETGLASVRDVWYEKDSATGDWTPKYADTSKAKDAAEFAQILDDFENDMKLLEEQGLAYKGKLPFGMKFRASRQQKMAHVVPVMINGKEYAVYVNGNPRPAQAINGETNSEAANASAWYDKIKRIYGAGLTSWNPDFIIPNMIRDGIHASTMTFLDAGPWAAIKFAANGPRAFGQVFAMVSGVKKHWVNPKYQAYFEEFVANGGETGYTAVHTLEDYKKEYDKLMKEVKGLKGKNLLKNGLEGAAKWLEAANRIFEDVNRFNAYVSARESGESIMRSVNAAKNITVNFNRKGALSANNTTFGIIANAMSKWILFFNPAVQGLAQLVTKTKMNPKRAAMMASTILASGVLMPMLNEALVAAAGDDEEDDYWNQSDFKRRNNWLLFTGDGYVSVPLPPVLRELYGIGDIIYGSITGRIPAERAVMDMARQIQSAIGFINLIPEVSQEPDAITWAKGLAPDVAAPILDVLSNTNFMGRPIAKWTDFNKYEPEYERVYKGVSPQWVELSKLLNEMGGQEGRRSDLWGNFINPAMMEHLFTNYGGGIGKTINNLAGMVWDGIEGNTENLDPYRKSPIAPRFYIPNDEKTVVPGINRKYYDYDYKYNIAKKAYKNYQEGVRSKEHPEWQKYIDEMKSNGELRFIQFFEQEAKKVKKLQNLIKEEPKNKKELEEKLIDVKAEIAVKCYEMLK